MGLTLMEEILMSSLLIIRKNGDGEGFEVCFHLPMSLTSIHDFKLKMQTSENE